MGDFSVGWHWSVFAVVDMTWGLCMCIPFWFGMLLSLVHYIVVQQHLQRIISESGAMTVT